MCYGCTPLHSHGVVCKIWKSSSLQHSGHSGDSSPLGLFSLHLLKHSDICNQTYCVDVLLWPVCCEMLCHVPDPNKYSFTDGKRVMTVKSAQKNTDIACFQCFVSNSVGEVFSDGCLNVICEFIVSCQFARRIIIIDYLWCLTPSRKSPEHFQGHRICSCQLFLFASLLSLSVCLSLSPPPLSLSHTHSLTHTHTHTLPLSLSLSLSHTHTHTLQMHALQVMGWYSEKKTKDQHAEEKRWVFSLDLKEKSEDECLTERGRESQITSLMYYTPHQPVSFGSSATSRSLLWSGCVEAYRPSA